MLYVVPAIVVGALSYWALDKEPALSRWRAAAYAAIAGALWPATVVGVFLAFVIFLIVIKNFYRGK